MNEEFVIYLFGRLRRLGENPSVDSILVNADITKCMQLTVREVFQNFGNQAQFSDWVKTTKEIEVTHLKRLDSAVKEGKLISKKLVKDKFIDPVENCHIKLLNDASKRIARRAEAMIKSGKSSFELQKFIQREIGSYIRMAKNSIRNGLRKI